MKFEKLPFFKNLFLVILAILTGLVTGIICAVFGKGLLFIEDFRTNHFIFLIPLLAPAGVLLVKAYHKWGGQCYKGMGLVFETGVGKSEYLPRRFLPFAFLSTWLTHFFGGSSGREGVAVQIGASIGFNLGELSGDMRIRRLLLLCGMSAGFAGLFGTPFAAVFFAMEVLADGKMAYEALIPCSISAIVALAMHHLLGLGGEKVFLSESLDFNIYEGVKVVVASLCFCAVGQIFARLLEKCKNKWFHRMIPNPAWRIFILGLVISASSFFLHHGRYSGLGLMINEAVYSGGEVFAYDWILKLVFTVLTLGAGFQGGELTPMFCIGSSFGYILGPFIGIPSVYCAALGYCAVFGSATNTLITPILIGCETFGWDNFPYFAVASIIAYSFNGGFSLYQKQKPYETILRLKKSKTA